MDTVPATPVLASQPRTSQPDAADVDLGSLLLMFWQGKAWILLFLALALLGGVFHYLNTPRSYQADALIQIEQRGANIGLPDAMRKLADNETRTITEVEIIRSRLVLGQAVSTVNFDWQYGPDNPPYVGEFLVRLANYVPALAALLKYLPRAEVLQPEILLVPPAWLGRAIVLTAGEDGKFTVLTPDGIERSGRVGELLSDPGTSFAFKVARLAALPGRRFVLSQRDELSSIGAMRSALEITELGRQSGILRLRFSAPSREEAERVLGAVTQAFVRQNVGRGAAEADSGADFVRAQLPDARMRLQTAEETLAQYRRRRQSIDLSFETQAVLTQMRTLEAELAALQAREDEVRTRYTARHPVYEQLLTQRRRLEEQLSSIQAQATALPSTQREIMSLMRDVEIAQATYTQLLTRAQELAVLSASTVGNVRLIDAARGTETPVSPRLVMTLGGAAGIGLILGGAFVLLRFALRTGLQSADELEGIGLPVFGVIGFSAKARRSASRKQYRILAQSDPSALTTEGFRSLRTSLHFGLAEGAGRAVAITSTHPQAGKSFVALNLAYVAAESGMRVCLIDADLRRGNLRRFFGVESDHVGLSDLLAQSAPLRDVRLRTEIDGLEFIPTGSYPPNPSELLMRRALPEALEEISKDTDLIIIDCPPALLLTDAALVARSTAATLLVARQGMTRLAELKAVVRQFEQSGLKVAGSVLNFFDPKNDAPNSYYRHKYYTYDYKPARADAKVALRHLGGPR